MANKRCACGHDHNLSTGWTMYSGRDYQRGCPAECNCNGFVSETKYQKFKRQHEEYEAKMQTPEGIAEVERERERLAKARSRCEPLTDVLDRLGQKSSKPAKLTRSRPIREQIADQMNG